MCNFYYFRFMDEYDFHDRILLYLYKFRNDFEFHDLFEHFKQSEYDVIWDRANALFKDGLIDSTSDSELYSMESNVSISKKREYFAKINKQGIEYVKNDIIRQLEVDTLRKQKIKYDSKRFWITTSLSLVGLFLLAFSIYQSGRISELEGELPKVKRQRDSLSTVTVDQYNLLRTRDTEIIKMKRNLDSLDNVFKVGQTNK